MREADDLRLYHEVFAALLGRRTVNGDACVAVHAVLSSAGSAMRAVELSRSDRLEEFLQEYRLRIVSGRVVGELR